MTASVKKSAKSALKAPSIEGAAAVAVASAQASAKSLRNAAAAPAQPSDANSDPAVAGNAVPAKETAKNEGAEPEAEFTDSRAHHPAAEQTTFEAKTDSTGRAADITPPRIPVDGTPTQSLPLPAPQATMSAPIIADPAVAAAAAIAVPLAALPVEIAAQAKDGKNRFEIRLDPPELGRIDVRLDIDRGGNVTSRLIVERLETLDLLRRDAHSIERALQDAGLKTSDQGMQFSLRDQTSTGQSDDPRPRPASLVLPQDDLVQLEAIRQGYGRLIGLGGGIDIRV